MYLSCLQRTRKPKRSLSWMMSIHSNIDCSVICPSKLVRLLHNSPTALFSPSTVAGYGERSKVISSCLMRPKIFLDTNELDLRVEVTFSYPMQFPMFEALEENPENAISMTFLRESNGYWQTVSNNSHLVRSVDRQSGSTYKLNKFTEEIWCYDMDIKSLSAGSTYLMVANIAKHLPKSHMFIVKFRLVCFLQQALCEKSQRSLHPGLNSRPPSPES